ncbi:hypothetical protein SDC9_146979 [bioreactor metagenome]|uniref:Uncharacterized protein n=1 Tax=bioreactor metagenome TaxID=1076179 RepID=A0A645EED6_9ZZZZ
MLQTPVLKPDVIRIVQVVNTDHLMALFQEHLDHPVSNKAGSPRDQVLGH